MSPLEAGLSGVQAVEMLADAGPADYEAIYRDAFTL